MEGDLFNKSGVPANTPGTGWINEELFWLLLLFNDNGDGVCPTNIGVKGLTLWLVTYWIVGLDIDVYGRGIVGGRTLG